MLFLAIDLNPLAAGADEVFQRCVQIQCVAHLVKVGDLQVGTLADFARRCRHIGQDFPQNKLEQCGFACAVGAQQANFVAA